MARVTGLGGIFYKAADTAATAEWYRDKLGLGGEWGIMFPHAADTPGGYSLLSAFKADTDYFGPSTQPFMVNLRVDDLDGFLTDLEAKGVKILARQDEEYGKFAWIMDPDGNKLELWEPMLWDEKNKQP